MLGHCCSSWVAISKGSTHRSYLNPMGHTGYEKVRDANLMSSRTAVRVICVTASCLFKTLLRTVILLLVLEAVSAVWLVEQPGSSLLFESDRFRWLIHHLETLNMRVF